MESAANFLLAQLPACLVLVATALVQWGERRVDSYNYAYLKAVSAEELIPRPLQQYYSWATALPWLSFFISLWLPARWKLASFSFWSLGLIFLGFLLYFSAMRSLGRLWSRRCLFVPGMPRVWSGPYRLARHPEYIGRVEQGLGFISFFGLNPLTLGLWIYGLSLLPKIVKTESRQLDELSLAPLQLQGRSSTVGTSD